MVCRDYAPLPPYLGRFSLTSEGERQAALTYDATAKIAFGEYACLNFLPEESARIVLPERVLKKIRTSLRNIQEDTPLFFNWID
jgi:hypothetical protein